MKSKVYQDCYMKFDSSTDELIIGNSLIERKFIFIKGHPYCDYTLNKLSGKKWANDKAKMFHIGHLNELHYNIDIYSEVIDLALNGEYLLVKVIFQGNGIKGDLTFTVYPDTPFITSRMKVKNIGTVHVIKSDEKKQNSGIEMNYQSGKKGLIEDTIDSIGYDQPHIKVKSYKLYDVTDAHNTLVKLEKGELYYKKNASRHHYEGSIFIIDSYLEEEGLIVVKEAPTEFAAQNKTIDDLIIEPGSYIRVTGSSLNGPVDAKDEFITCYGVTIGVGQPGELCRLYKKHYLQEWYHQQKPLFTMSNTWGDRNQDKAVCESFILKEIEIASEMGINVVQIDDGWQKGITSNSALAKNGVWEGYYDFDPDFWDIHQDKFPNGFGKIIRYARNKKVEIGLWFSPDSSHDFSNWQKDGSVILDYYKRYGIRYYKLDGIKVRNKQCEINLVKLFSFLEKESKGQIRLNLDITAEERFGYLYEKQYGTLFVENRYTDWRSYYPHYTLKNIWQLSQVIPTQRLQMELLNNKRNKDIYEDDPLAPHHYSMDYLFAITMVTNPLFWMELSGLEKEDQQKLKAGLKVFDTIKDDILQSEVMNIGEMPDGTSFTGFQIIKGAESGYLLIFKELTTEREHVYQLNDVSDCKIVTEIIYTNAQESKIIVSDCVGSNGELKIKTGSHSRIFALIKYVVKGE
ncbi:alpha-amylase family protein [Vallitalea okinawensis]|uniref:alpha-galactosidase n=1 Tax=Vallitalea okinawensis TaxID=2078660 RepID=UPI000CFC1C82|nr:alpha-galactosidase [Vallitalea okinawensis]